MSTLPDTFASANLLAEQNRLAEAENLYRQILARNPQHHGAIHGLGIVAFKSGNIGLAMKLIVSAIRLNGEIGLYHRNLGELFRVNKQIDKAILAGQNATALMPDDASAFYNLALAYAGNNNDEDAIVCYKVAISLDTHHVMAMNNLGNLYAAQGKMDDAKLYYYQAIIRKPDFIDAHYNLSALKTYNREDEHYELLKSLDSKAETLPAQAQINLQFTLGKAHEDTGNYAAAFSAYENGNALYRKASPYNEAEEIRNHQAIQHAFNAEFIRQHLGLGADDTGAIFIIGMPRSGSTLVEQILSSHSQIHGAGETPDLSAVMDEFSAPGKLFFPQKLQNHDFAALGQAYMRKMQKHSSDPQKVFVCNKTHNNFLHLGLIKLILPNAKIIHVVRDPMDSCFSCYAKLFSEPVDFCYNQQELGRYYVRYREMVKYWESVLPANSIHTVQYEKLIRETEAETRAMLEYIGVAWQQECMDFQNNQRKVHTASIAQVRQPIYSTSIARWEHFAEGLQPLLEIVGEWR